MGGQLGTGNLRNVIHPQKILELPPVQSVACGAHHTLILTKEGNLWSCGWNLHGQLCLENKTDQLKPKQTSFSNIINIATGEHGNSFFQNNIGEIYGCGRNESGLLGLGHNNSPQIEVCQIPVSSNIIQFCCGFSHSLFLDSEGNVFSAGYNGNGSLGRNDNVNQNMLGKIPNIPPIRIISCCGDSSYLLDFDGNIWSFGCNVWVN